MQITPSLLDWLLAGDPAIRWQVQRDLLGAPEAEWQAERRRLLEHGWAADLLARQNPDGGWGEGPYSPKWTSTTYTLLALREMGLPRDCPQAQRGARVALDRLLGPALDDKFRARLVEFDRCIAGMLLEICAYFEVEDARVPALVQNLLDEQMPDGGWNCRRHRKPAPHHSSFHTTQNVLDGLQEFRECAPAAPLAQPALAAQRAAWALLCQHSLYRSDKTGQIIKASFAMISYPHRWFYDYLRALDHFARAGAPRDPRLNEPIERLRQSQTPDGRWHTEIRHESGKLFFRLEPGRASSRWNTLRALRVLRWWQAGPPAA